MRPRPRPRTSAFLATLAAGALALLVAPNARAQLMASEPATIAQTVDGTKVTVTYSRPRARGRTGLFGTQVYWGEIWTPGANAATTLAASKDVTIEGMAVPKGKYSVWIVVAKGAEWEMVLDRDTALFHMQGPKQRPGQIRFRVRRETRPFMEALTWWVPDVRAAGMTLAMQWDTVYVPLDLKVTPSYTTAVARDAAERVAGRYRLKWTPSPEPPKDTTAAKDTTARKDASVAKDTTAGKADAPSNEVNFTIRYEGGELRAIMAPTKVTESGSKESGSQHWVLIPRKAAADVYYLGRVERGEMIEASDDGALQFTVVGGRATGFEFRGKNDDLWGTGKRLP
ncbi:MAG: DUF2911 domain-containing protein [Gemmatimonadaceae bacterium]